MDVVIQEEIRDLVAKLATHCTRQSRRSGFWKDRDALLSAHDPTLTPERCEQFVKSEAVALIHSEVSELLEAVRNPLPDGSPQPSDHVAEISLEEEELADILIRVFDYAGGFDLLLGTALVAKLQFNAERPPMHGKDF